MSSKRAPSSIDSEQRARLVGVVLIGGIPGAILGAIAGARFAAGTTYLVPATVVGALVGSVCIVLAAQLISSGAGTAAGSILFPGQGRPARSGHSLADSLVARGRFQEAVELFDETADEDPEDPEDPIPLLRSARVLRDDLARPQDAILRFARALDRVPAGSPAAEFIEREIAEIGADRPREERSGDAFQ